MAALYCSGLLWGGDVEGSYVAGVVRELEVDVERWFAVVGGQPRFRNDGQNKLADWLEENIEKCLSVSDAEHAMKRRL